MVLIHNPNHSRVEIYFLGSKLTVYHQHMKASKFHQNFFKLASQRLAFPLSLMHANSYASKRLILIGDAAHTVHPLAGQGVNMGFADARSLSKVIAEGVAVGSDIGEVTLLK